MHGKIPEARADLDADRAVTALYTQYYRSLVRLAAFLVHDTAAAEELVQDSFVAVHAAWHRLQDADHALSYLRQSVVARSRSLLRHRAVVDKIAPKLTPGWPVTEQTAVIQPTVPRCSPRCKPCPPARGPGAALLRRHVGGRDRLRHGNQQRSCQKPHRPRHVVATRGTTKLR